MYLKCRTSKIATINKLCAVTIYPFAASICLISSTVNIFKIVNLSKPNNIWMIVLGGSFHICIFTVGILMMWLSIHTYRFESRKYFASEQGISLPRMHNRTCVVPWSKVSEISAQAFAATASLEKYQPVFCVLLKPGPKDFARKILKGYLYAVRNQDWLVVIDFTEESKKIFEMYYTNEIQDRRYYRNTR